MNEPKKYVLTTIPEMNRAMEALSGQQKKLADASAKLADEEKADQEKKKKVRSR